jgi:hypothetical protein
VMTVEKENAHPLSCSRAISDTSLPTKAAPMQKPHHEYRYLYALSVSLRGPLCQCVAAYLEESRSFADEEAV